jgi:hypothetical protein
MNTKLLQILRFKSGNRISVTGLTTWRPDLKVWHHLFVPLLEVARLVTGKLTRSRIIQCASFAKHCCIIYKKQGMKGLVVRLKIMNVMFMKSLPGAKSSSSSRDIGGAGVSRSSDGLPKVIPNWARILIRRGDIDTIRLWSTLFGLYRVLMYTGKPSISTITDDGVPLSPSFLKGWTTFVRSSFIPMLKKETGTKLGDLDPGKVLKVEYLPISSAASNSKNGTSSLGTAVFSAFHWLNGESTLLADYLHYLDQWELTNTIWSVMHDCISGFSGPVAKKFVNGRLHFIPEPAGKVRVVALVDYWTQIALYPLHRFIFDILKDIDQDGTFNQVKPVKALLKKTPKDQIIYSYDLSAATDRLPICVQVAILATIFTPYFAEAWRAILVDRSYNVPDFEYLEKGRAVTARFPESVKYKVGQPIGAYSSWAMLALTHHALVQFSAQSAGYTEWFCKYAILGDDIVIADDAVAKAYLSLLKALGVKVGLAKSLISSDRTLEFAKRLFFRGVDVSGLPWKLFGVSKHNLSVAISLLSRLGDQGIKFSPANAVLAFGGSWKMSSTTGNSWDKISRRTMALLVSASHPNARTPFSFETWVAWLSSHGPNTSMIPKGITMTWFTPWCTGLLEEYLGPMLEKANAIHYAHLWNMGLPGGFNGLPKDPSHTQGFERLLALCDRRSSALIVLFDESLEKFTISLKHLQKLNIKFMFHQASAVFTQGVNVCEDRLSAIPKPAKELVFQALDQDRPPVLRTLSTWMRWRARVFTEQAIGTGYTGTGVSSPFPDDTTPKASEADTTG